MRIRVKQNNHILEKDPMSHFFHALYSWPWRIDTVLEESTNNVIQSKQQNAGCPKERYKASYTTEESTLLHTSRVVYTVSTETKKHIQMCALQNVGLFFLCGNPLPNLKSLATQTPNCDSFPHCTLGDLDLKYMVGGEGSLPIGYHTLVNSQRALQVQI